MIGVILALALSGAGMQVTSLPQGADVRPKDWAAQTLGRLINSYGCMSSGTPTTYRGNRPVTRYEFAAGLNACRGYIRPRILEAQGPHSQDAEDLTMLEQQFAPELATLDGRVEALEAKTTTLEAQQFSNTTKLGQPGAFGQGQPKRGKKRVPQ